MLKLFYFKTSYSVQFVASFLLGWFVLGSIWNFVSFRDSQSKSSLQCNCLNIECKPCNHFEDNADLIEKRNDEIGNGSYRSYRFKPQWALDDEVNRWRLLTKKHNYEMINQEPCVGINGMWKAELKEVNAEASKAIYADDPSQSDEWELDDLHRHYDPFYGVEYFAHYLGKRTGSRKSIELRRPFLAGKPRLVSMKHAAGDEVINIICPISKVTHRFNRFLNDYERHVINDSNTGPLRLLFVIFHMEGGSNDGPVNRVVALLNNLMQRHPTTSIDYIFVEGEFNRAVGLHSGVLHCKEDEIVLFLDVDLKIGSGFLGRVRRNTQRGKRVIFPIMFSQYDPDVIDKAAAINPDVNALTRDKLEINKQTGFWIYYAYGVAAMYKSDYLKVGGFRLDIKGWGGEDVDLFKKMVADGDLQVMSLVDKDLIHIYHPRGCDSSLAPDQYEMCVGAWSETLGSQLEVATLYLNDLAQNVPR